MDMIRFLKIILTAESLIKTKWLCLYEVWIINFKKLSELLNSWFIS